MTTTLTDFRVHQRSGEKRIFPFVEINLRVVPRELQVFPLVSLALDPRNSNSLPFVHTNCLVVVETVIYRYRHRLHPVKVPGTGRGPCRPEKLFYRKNNLNLSFKLIDGVRERKAKRHAGFPTVSEDFCIIPRIIRVRVRYYNLHRPKSAFAGGT